MNYIEKQTKRMGAVTVFVGVLSLLGLVTLYEITRYIVLGMFGL